jgi:hypothetical protein
MADAANQPTEADVRGFLAKLTEFRAALPDSEKAVLDALTTAAVSRSDQEVEGFGLTETAWPLIVNGWLSDVQRPAKGRGRDMPSVVQD